MMSLYQKPQREAQKDDKLTNCAGKQLKQAVLLILAPGPTK